MRSEGEMAVVVASNDEDVLRSNLLASDDIDSDCVVVQRGFACAGEAYNAAIAQIRGECALFVHQDVYLPAGWFQRAKKTVAELGTDWGVLGCFGRTGAGRDVGRVWSSGIGREIGCELNEPVEVRTLDEMLLIVNTASGLQFDASMPSFHLYGTGIVQMAIDRGCKCYAADLPAIHNSVPVGLLGASYRAAYRYMQRKYADRLPLDTLVVPITRSGYSMHRFNLKKRLKGIGSKRSQVGRHADPAKLAEELGYTS